jgi:hypothetical protein
MAPISRFSMRAICPDPPSGAAQLGHGRREALGHPAAVLHRREVPIRHFSVRSMTVSGGARRDARLSARRSQRCRRFLVALI